MEAQSSRNCSDSKRQRCCVLDLNQYGVLPLSPIKKEMIYILEKVLLTG